MNKNDDYSEEQMRRDFNIVVKNWDAIFATIEAVPDTLRQCRDVLAKLLAVIPESQQRKQR